MRKLCDKNCEDCEIEECLLKRPPWDWRPAERTRSEQSKQARRSYQAKKENFALLLACVENACAVMQLMEKSALNAMLKSTKETKQGVTEYTEAKEQHMVYAFFAENQ